MATYAQWVAAIEAAYPADVSPETRRRGVHVALAVAMMEGGLRTSGELSWVSKHVYDQLVARGWYAGSWDEWSRAARASNNLGAVQYRRPQDFGAPPWPATTTPPAAPAFLYMDTSPQQDGSSVPYPMYFRSYGVDEAAGGFLRTLYVVHGRESVRLAAERGDLYEVSRLLRATRYYEGFGADQEARIANHHKSLVRSAVAVARALGWSMPDNSPLPRPTLREGATGEDVRYLQATVGVDQDGRFGPRTAAALREWQVAHGLLGDGVAGPATWAAIRAAGDPPAGEPEVPPDTVPPDTEPVVPGSDVRASLLQARQLIDDALAALGEP